MLRFIMISIFSVSILVGCSTLNEVGDLKAQQEKLTAALKGDCAKAKNAGAAKKCLENLKTGH